MKDVQTDLVFTALPTDYVTRLWPQIAKVLEKSVATADGKYTTDDVYSRIMDEELVAWVVLDPAKDDEIIAAVTTRLVKYPNRYGMSMDFIGGARMQEWLPMAHSQILRYAKDHNCWHMEGYGRKGWGRWLRRYGWFEDYTVFTLNLENGEPNPSTRATEYVKMEID